jgi:hypothetical protein
MDYSNPAQPTFLPIAAPLWRFGIRNISGQFACSRTHRVLPLPTTIAILSQPLSAASSPNLMMLGQLPPARSTLRLWRYVAIPRGCQRQERSLPRAAPQVRTW